MNSIVIQLPEEDEKKKAWESPQVIVLALDQATQGNPAALFEDTDGIASS